MSMDSSPTIVDQLNGTRTLSLSSEGDSVSMTLIDGDLTIAKLGSASLYELKSVFVAGATILPFVDDALVGFHMHLDGDTIKFSKDDHVVAQFEASDVRAAIFPEDS